jgi:hypothetical protein
MLKSKLKNYCFFSDIVDKAQEIWKKEILKSFSCGQADVEDKENISNQANTNLEGEKKILSDK